MCYYPLLMLYFILVAFQSNTSSQTGGPGFDSMHSHIDRDKQRTVLSIIPSIVKQESVYHAVAMILEVLTASPG